MPATWKQTSGEKVAGDRQGRLAVNELEEERNETQRHEDGGDAAGYLQGKHRHLQTAQVAYGEQPNGLVAQNDAVLLEDEGEA